jgi:hypothetical protein
MSFHSKAAWAGLLVLAAACNTDSGTPTGTELGTASSQGAAAAQSQPQQAPLLVIADLPTVTVSGSASLTRLPNGITTHVKVDPGVIPVGDVITVWGLIFNNPSACANPSACGESDLFIDGPEGSPMWMGSGIASGNSTTYTGHVKVGDTSGALFGPGLQNVEGAQVLVVLRTHGPKINGQLQSQRNSFEGPNCTFDPEPNPDVCEDLLVAPFPAL